MMPLWVTMAPSGFDITLLSPTVSQEAASRILRLARSVGGLVAGEIQAFRSPLTTAAYRCRSAVSAKGLVEDPLRRSVAGVPEDVRFQTKPEITWGSFATPSWSACQRRWS